MKKSLLLMCSLLAHCICFSQVPTIQWQKCIGGSDHDKANAVVATSDGGYIVAGTTNSTDFDAIDNHGGRDFLVTKLDANGAIQWKKCYGGTNDEFANCVVQTADDGYVIAGKTESNDGDVVGNPFNTVAAHAWVIKINSAGVLQWQRMTPANNGEITSVINTMIETPSGSITLGGNSYFPTGGNGYGDVYLATIGADGAYDSSTNLIVGGGANDNLFSIKPTNDGGLIAAGGTYSRTGIYSTNHGTGAVCDYWIFKVSSFGAVEWQKLYGGSGNDEAYSVIQTNDGGYLLAGYTWSDNDGDVTGNHAAGYYDGWMVKLDSSGNLQWQKCLGSNFYDKVHSVVQESNGTYVLAGYSRETANSDVTGNHGNSDFWVVNLSTNGTIVWQQSYGGSGWDEAYCIQKTTDNGYVVCGSTGSDNFDVSGFHGNTFFTDYWVIKLSAASLGLTNYSTTSQLVVYPNPCSSTVSLALANDDVIDQVVVRDLYGKVVLQQAQATTLAIESLQSGMYFVEVRSGAAVYIQKFIKQ